MSPTQALALVTVLRSEKRASTRARLTSGRAPVGQWCPGHRRPDSNPDEDLQQLGQEPLSNPDRDPSNPDKGAQTRTRGHSDPDKGA
jgi:hypothetical protein